MEPFKVYKMLTKRVPQIAFKYGAGRPFAALKSLNPFPEVIPSTVVAEAKVAASRAPAAAAASMSTPRSAPSGPAVSFNRNRKPLTEAEITHVLSGGAEIIF